MSPHRPFLSFPLLRSLPAAALFAALMALAPVAVAGAATPEFDAPRPIERLIYARSFTLEEGFSYQWSAERPRVREGMLLVLEADPDLVRARESAEPVLYVDRFPVRRLARDETSGRMLVLVPARVKLTEAEIWFGAPDLPERVTVGVALEQAKAARAAGVAPLERSAVRSALKAGGAPADLHSRAELWSLIEELVAEYLPSVADDSPEGPRARE